MLQYVVEKELQLPNSTRFDQIVSFPTQAGLTAHASLEAQ